MEQYVIRKCKPAIKYHCLTSKDNIVQYYQKGEYMTTHFIENQTLATELLHELKTSAKRWFIAFCIMVLLEVTTIAGFLWYISLPIEESSYTVQEMEDIDGSTATQNANTP